MNVYTVEIRNTDTWDGILGVYDDYKLAVKKCKEEAMEIFKIQSQGKALHPKRQGKITRRNKGPYKTVEVYYVFKDELDVYFQIEKFTLNDDLTNHY
jgi:hypothetical protein